MPFSWETFPALTLPGLCHAFSLRGAEPPEALPGLLRPSVSDLGWGNKALITAEQPHGSGVAVVDEADDREADDNTMREVDALVTCAPGVALAIRVADCGPIYFFDPVARFVALAHSGKKGTELNLLGAVVKTLRASGSRPADLTVFLGPCIRPPFYEVDFAAEIGRQAARAGVGTFIDSGLNTAADLCKYYSYRMEKGKTGRMWAVAMLAP